MPTGGSSLGAGTRLDNRTWPANPVARSSGQFMGSHGNNGASSEPRGNLVRIRSEHSGLVLSTDAQAGNRSWVWLEKDRSRPDQLWRLEPTSDKTAFVIETPRSAHALDATPDPRIPAGDASRSVDEPTSPVLYETNAGAWQQWVIARLPLGQPAV